MPKQNFYFAKKWEIFLLVVGFLLFRCAYQAQKSQADSHTPIGNPQLNENIAKNHYSKATKYARKLEYTKALEEYQKALLATRDREMIFSCYNNMGANYFWMGNESKAEESYCKSAKAWPERAYYPYLNLSILKWKQGKSEKALKYIQMAVGLVQSNEYEELELRYSGYRSNTAKKCVLSYNSYLEMATLFEHLNKLYTQKDYLQAKVVANQLLGETYLVDIGISASGNSIANVTPGSIADLNGIVKGDEILEIAGKPMLYSTSTYNTLAKLCDKFNQKVNFEIKRKGRTINMKCHLYYPELEKAHRMLKEIEEAIAIGKAQKIVKDIEPPQLMILKPKTKRGIRILAEGNVDFEILAGDNFEVRSVSINNNECKPSEASALEKTFLRGSVRKYIAKVSANMGNNIYKIKAIDSSENETTKQVIVSYSLKTKPSEDFYRYSIGVVIGINKYQSWPSLEFSVNDARAIKNRLIEEGFDTVFELYDEEATRIQILRLLSDKLPAILGEDDRLMVFFAGHGHTEIFKGEDGLESQEGYIVPMEGDINNSRGTAISMTTIHDNIKKYKAKHVLYAFDSCYSGLGLKRSGGSKKVDEYIKSLARKKAVQIITAGGKGEQAGEEKGHGIFTKALLQAVDGEADMDKDGFVTASEIATFVKPKVSRKTRGTQTPQFGWLNGEGDFIFEIFRK